MLKRNQLQMTPSNSARIPTEGMGNNCTAGRLGNAGIYAGGAQAGQSSGRTGLACEEHGKIKRILPQSICWNRVARVT